MGTFRVDPATSTVAMAAKSSLHPIQGVARDVRGEVQAEDGQPTALRLEVGIASIESGNALYDRTLPKAVDARKFPTITAVAREVQGSEVGRLQVDGEVTFHGQSRAVTGLVEVVTEDDGALRLRGEHTFDVRDFGLTPPKLLGLKVYPEVTVTIDIRAVGTD